MTKTKLPESQQFCFCHDGVSLQMVSGGAAVEGYLGKITLLIDGEYVDYVKKQKQEPVAWRGYNWGHSPDDWVYRDFDDPILDGNGNNVGQPLYTSPPPRQPLSDEVTPAMKQAGLAVCVHTELDPTWEELEIIYKAMNKAAHGIKGEA